MFNYNNDNIKRVIKNKIQRKVSNQNKFEKSLASEL